MSWLKEIMRRADYLGRRSQFEQELGDEIQFHIETRVDELRREGVPPAEALQAARREFGPRARISEDTRGAWQFQWMEDLWRDLSHGVRAFAKSPGFTAVAVLSLGVGVGANCVMFSIVDATLLRPPRVPRPNEVVALVSTALDSNSAGISYPDFAAVRDRSQSFEGLAAFTEVSTGFAAQPGVPPLVKGGKAVTADFFDVLGSRPELGRSFLPEEDSVSGKDLVAVLSHRCWQEQFAADPAALGKQARINGLDFTIVGVMPARFTDVDDDLMDDNACFFIPLRAVARIGSSGDLISGNLIGDRGQRSLTVFGRLKPGVLLARARTEVATIAGTLEKEFPETNRNRSLLVRTLIEFRSGGSAGITVGAIAMAIAAMVLLIACANVAGLLTSRAPARAQEIAMRLAIGAGRPRLIRQLLAESLLLAAGGAVVGVAVGYIPIALARRLAAQFEVMDSQPFPLEVDVRVLLFGLGLAFSSVILFGLMPAFRATRADLTSVMKSRGASAPPRGLFAKLFRGGNVLVASQVAISLLLLTATTVLYAGIYQSFVTSVRNPGFQVDHLLAIDFEPSSVHLKDARAEQFFKDLVERLHGAKGVRAAAVVYQDVASIRPGSPVAHEDAKTSGVWTGEGFFDTLGIPILEGRAFQAADLRGSPSVAVVNDVLAKRYWPGQNPIGKQIRLGTGQWVSVIGVARIKAFMAFGTPPMDTIFLPYAKPNQRDIRLLVRSAADPRTLVDPIRAIVRDLDPDQVVPEAMPFQAMFDAWIKGALLGLNTLGAMGVLGLVLALVGLYGLLAHEVSSRTREIGIRMALGAHAGDVVRMVLRQGIALAICGVGAGVALNLGLVKVLDAVVGSGGGSGDDAAKPPEPNGGNQIHIHAGTDSFGGHAFTILVIAVFAVTILAAYLPARRAARVDPNVALRAE